MDYSKSNWETIIRGTCDNDLNTSQFTGLMSLLPLTLKSFKVKGGNSELVEELFGHSESKVHLSSKVTSLSFNGDSYSLTYQNENKNFTENYDFVIIGSPIENTKMNFKDISLPKTKRTFNAGYITIVSADSLNSTYFNSSNNLPDTILTLSNSTSPFIMIDVVNEGIDGKLIYKLFSRESIPLKLINQLFVKPERPFSQFWPYAFPQFKPTNNFQPIILQKNLFNLNAMESIGLGTSSISGRNIALIISKLI